MTYSIPFASTRWDEIIPNLFQGGHDWRDPESFETAVIVRHEFDIVFSLYRSSLGGDPDGHGPAAGVDHLTAEVLDAGLGERSLGEVRAMAELVTEAVRAGRKTLVRCQAGYNRSGLVVAFVLLRLGWTPGDAIDRIRSRRSQWALCNEHFVRYIHAEAKALAA